MKITEELIPFIEKALGFELYEWQKSFLLGETFERPSRRVSGRTTAYIVKLLLTNEELIDIKMDAKRYQDHPGYTYTSFFQHEMRTIDHKLTSVGLLTRLVKPKKVIGNVGGIEVSMDTQNLQRKLRAIAKHTEALANELDSIDAAKCPECGNSMSTSELFADGESYSLEEYCERCNK